MTLWGDPHSNSARLNAVVGVLLSAAFSACGQSFSSAELVELVPSDAVAVVRVHWAAIRGDRVLQRFAPISEIFALTKELEIPSTATESIVVFSTTFGSSTSGDTAILLTPGVAQQSIRAVSDRGWSSESLDGVTIYRNPLSGIGAVALSHDVLAIGPRASVDQVVRTAHDRDLSLLRRSEFADLRGALTGAESVAMAFVWPQTAQDVSKAAVAVSAQALRFVGWGPLGTLVEKLGVGRALTAACSRESGGVRLSLTGLMQDEDSATIVSGGLTLLKGLAGLVPPQPPGPSSTDIGNMTVDRHGALVSVTMLVNDQRR